MLINKWVPRCLALLISLNLGIAAAQGDPVITPDTIAQVQEVQRLGNRTVIPVVAWSPDGTGLVAGADGGFWLYPALGQTPVFYPLDDAYQVASIMFAPQGDLLFVGDGQEIIAYDLAQNSIRYTLDGFQPLAFSYSKEWLVYEVDDGARISQVTSGEVVYDLSCIGKPHWPEESEPGDDYTQKNSIVFAHFLPGDNDLIVRWETFYAGGWEGREYSGYDRWSLGGDQPSVAAIEDLYNFVPNYPDMLSALPDGRVFAIKEGSVLTENSSVVLELAAPQPDFYAMDYTTHDWIVAFSYHPWSSEEKPAPSRIVVGIWDIRTGEQINEITVGGVPEFSPDGRQIVVNTTVYDVATGVVTAQLQADNYRVLPGTDRILLLASDNTIHLLDSITLADIATLDIARSEIIESSYPAADYVISEECNTVSFRTPDTKRWVRIDLDSGNTLVVFETTGFFTEAATYTPDCRHFITQVLNNNRPTQVLWDAFSGQPVDLPPMTRVKHPDFSPNGLVVLVHSTDNSTNDPPVNEIMLYDAVSAVPVMTFPIPQPAEGTSSDPEISFSPRDTYLGIRTDQAFGVWDWQAGEQVLALGSVLDPTFSPDDQLLAYGTASGKSVEVMSMPEGEIIWQLDIEPSAMLFDTETLLRIIPMSEALSTTCYDLVTLSQQECPGWPVPASLEAGDMRFFIGEQAITVKDMDGAERARIALPLPRAVVRLALSSDRTRLWLEYSDGTLGLWTVVPE